MKFLFKLSTLTISTLLSYNVYAADTVAEASDSKFLETAFQCTTAETIAFIESQTFQLKLPKGIPNQQELVDAYVATVCEEDPDSPECKKSCFQMPDFEFDVDWQDLIDAYDKIIQNMPKMSSFGNILDKLQAAFDKALDEVMKKIAEGVCDAADMDKIKEQLSKRANEVINDRYGFDMNNIDSASKKVLEDKLYERYGKDSEYFYDPSEFSNDRKKEARDKIKEKDDKFWKGI